MYEYYYVASADADRTQTRRACRPYIPSYIIISPFTMASSSKSSSFSAFNEVDDTVAKPVLGSDGAARWQDFKQDSKLPTKLSVAPALPLKKLDRALGTKSIRDEQANEAKIRKDAGDREAGSGYTTFKRKSDHEEIAAAKKRKLILEKVRPDDVPYFIAAETYEGYKFDYVFTTRDNRGTGYYWDGTDSYKKEMGLAPTYPDYEENVDDVSGDTETKTKKKKSSKKKHKVPIADEFNPMEQIANAISRRNQLAGMGAPGIANSVDDANKIAKADAAALGVDANVLNSKPQSSSAAPTALDRELIVAGWESTNDPKSGKHYYFHRASGKTSWSKPDLPKRASEENAEHRLPDGWKSAKDSSSGKVYYYHTSGKTSWTKPTKEH